MTLLKGLINAKNNEPVPEHDKYLEEALEELKHILNKKADE
jgi:hypothetical protein